MTSTDILFRPLKIGDLELPNRVLMAPLTRNRAHPDGTPWDVAQTYYGQRASAGLIVSEATQISAIGKGYVNTPGIYTDGQTEAWHKIVDAVHAGGGHIFCQLWHVGRVSHVSLLPEGMKPHCPSAVKADTQTFTENGFEDCSEPVAMTLDDIQTTLDDYAQAAKCAKKAGFDGVEVHCANGYLLDQFLQNGVNQRDGKYGGSIENRMRMLSEVLDRVCTIFPPGRVGVRLSPLGQANDVSDSDAEKLFEAVYRMLSNRKLGYLHVVEEFYGTDTSDDERKLLKKLRELYAGVYIGNGGYDGDRAAEAISDGLADAVTFGRPFIANPDLPERIRQTGPFNQPDKETFYGGDEAGYTDYQFLDRES